MDAKALIDQILQAKYCGDFFEEGTENSIRSRFRECAKLVHPDVCSDPRAEEAFNHLAKLNDRAMECLKLGVWDETDMLRLPGKPKIRYKHSLWFELGKRFVTDDRVIWVLDLDKNKYLKRFIHTEFTYRDDKMLKMYRNRIPVVEDHDDQAIFLKKDPKEFPMDLFLSAYGDKLTARDIAWMISRMCDLLCFLHFHGLTLNGIEPENLFINPDLHSIHIYGGWWYATKIGQKMIGVSKNIYNIMPFDIRNTKIASPATDIESVRIMFQRICEGKDIPKPMNKWLNAGSLENPIEEYERWNEALDKSWGKRKFMVFSANADEIYSQN